jgi:MraZ protein
MFLGTSEHSLDEKNRVVLPLVFRKDISDEELKNGFVLAAGSESRYLELHFREDWRSHVQAMEDRYAPDDDLGQEYLRDLHSSAVEVELDKQYRFLIPDARREEAGIHRDVYFVGMNKRIEIWAKDRWEERQKDRKGRMRVPAASKGPELEKKKGHP